MTRKAWMPDPTLSAWVTFLGKALALSVMVGSGGFLLTSGVIGFQAMRVEVTETSANVDTLTTEMVGVRTDIDGLTEEFKDFRVEMRCVVGMFVDGEEPGYRDCVPVEANGGES